MKREFKVGVSDWKIIFERDVVQLKTIQKEIVSIDADGIANIMLFNCTFDTHLLYLFENKNTILSLEQSFDLTNSMGNKRPVSYQYGGKIKIKRISYISDEHDGITISTIALVCS